MTSQVPDTGRFSIYFAGAVGKVKIGCSSRPTDRILSVGEWIPYPITMLAIMPGSYALEAALHRMFAEEWSHGEWFDASLRLLDFIEKVRLGLPVEIINRELSIEADRRRKAISDKKCIARWKRRLPTHIVERINAVQKGEAIPTELLAETKALIDAIRCAA